MNTALLFRAGWMLAFLMLLSCPSWAQTWAVLGPDGGDARSLAYDPSNPDRIWLGTGTGTLFLSTDRGRSWSRFATLGNGTDNIIDHIVISPINSNIIFASAWSVEDQVSGDIFRSQDGGKTWKALPATHGRPIRALAISTSDPNLLVAGALDGVYRSKDCGDTWERISPANHEGVKNIESIAIDPTNPSVLYAGTRHLAWKTDDGGRTWHQIKKGMIDDSDVFSIIVNPANPSVVFAGACSGIYVSDNGGEAFHKVQGIPFSARRTRVLKQDPADPNVIYGGTTQGLWKTNDRGQTWKQFSNSEVVVNDILIDPRNSSLLLLATDRGGILTSDDRGRHFYPSNHGYAHRYVTTILPDKDDPEVVFVGVSGDRQWGGIFFFRNSSQAWQQYGAGLDGRDVLTLKQHSDGALVAGTNRGVFILDRGGRSWRPSNNVTEQAIVSPLSRGTRGHTTMPRKLVGSLAEARINDIDLTPELWLAATSEGLFTSRDEGRTWSGGPVLGRKDLISLHSNETLRVVATRSEVLVSKDDCAHWRVASLPARLTTIRGVIVLSPEAILVVSGEGAFRSSDSGQTWQRMLNGLPERDLSSISYAGLGKDLLATSLTTGVIFQSKDGGRSWKRGPDSGYPLLQVKVVGSRLFGATRFDGLIAQP